jgi:hypothetical protein
LKFYNATKEVDGNKFDLCGWLPSDENVKAANLVPKTLVGEELNYLFGEDEVVLMNPRNGSFFYFLLFLN